MSEPSTMYGNLRNFVTQGSKRKLAPLDADYFPSKQQSMETFKATSFIENDVDSIWFIRLLLQCRCRHSS